MLDMFKNEINVGDLVCCAVMRMECSELRTGIVSKVHPGTDNKLTIKGFRKTWYGDEEWESVNGTISYAHKKAIKLSPEQIPQSLFPLLQETREKVLKCMK